MSHSSKELSKEGLLEELFNEDYHVGVTYLRAMMTRERPNHWSLRTWKPPHEYPKSLQDQPERIPYKEQYDSMTSGELMCLKLSNDALADLVPTHTGHVTARQVFMEDVAVFKFIGEHGSEHIRDSEALLTLAAARANVRATHRTGDLQEAPA